MAALSKSFCLMASVSEVDPRADGQFDDRGGRVGHVEHLRDVRRRFVLPIDAGVVPQILQDLVADGLGRRALRTGNDTLSSPVPG